MRVTDAGLKDGYDLETLADELAAVGTCRVDGLWSHETADAVLSEAVRVLPRAVPAARDRYETVAGCLAGPLRQRWSMGELLRSLQESPLLTALVSRLGRRPMEPVEEAAAYLYYERGDYCGLHTDRPDFEIQFLFHVSGEIGPLVVYPGLASTPFAEVAERCASDGIPPGGTELHYSRFGVTALRSADVPHQRPPHADGELGIVAGLSYRSMPRRSSAGRVACNRDDSSPSCVPMDTTRTADLDTASRRVDVSALQALQSEGHVNVEGLWSEAFDESLAEEARLGWADAAAPVAGPRTPLVEGRRPAMQTPVSTGVLLSSLHERLTGLARALSGQLLVPAFAAYGYYSLDDEVLLHLDGDDCDLTLLTVALGAVGPLQVHPELRGMTMDELGALESDPVWDRDGGVKVIYPTRGVTVLRGRQLPHHRPARPLGELSAVAALHYRSLF